MADKSKIQQSGQPNQSFGKRSVDMGDLKSEFGKRSIDSGKNQGKAKDSVDFGDFKMHLKTK